MGLRGRTADLFDLTGRVAIVTGATRGIGAAIARALAEAGATVVVSSEDAAACTDAAAALTDDGLSALPIGCDLADAAQIRALVATTSERHGRIDMLVCNGGIEGPVGPIGEASETAIDRTIAINLKSAATLTTAAIPHMAERGGGAVVLISSIAGLRGNRAIGVYALTKAALAQLARNLAVEWGGRGVRVNAISPGLIHTAFSEALIADEAFMARRMAMTPLRRPGLPEEIAAAALFLLADGGAFVTGQNIVVDGGTLISDGS